MVRALLLSGLPGTGKTTIIRKAIAGAGKSVGGFYTGEMRAGGVRQGFRLTTIDGQRCILAHVDLAGPRRVGRYGVSSADLERVGVTAIRQAVHEKELVVIDEIGKMELFSSLFQEAVREAIDSDRRVLGTIMVKPHPFADGIKAHPQARVLTVTRENPEAILEEVLRWLEFDRS
ncbi:MAG: NTPase [Chloroflexota bacterium]